MSISDFNNFKVAKWIFVFVFPAGSCPLEGRHWAQAPETSFAMYLLNSALIRLSPSCVFYFVLSGDSFYFSFKSYFTFKWMVRWWSCSSTCTLYVTNTIISFKIKIVYSASEYPKSCLNLTLHLSGASHRQESTTATEFNNLSPSSRKSQTWWESKEHSTGGSYE